jgi:cell division protein FtsB
MKKILFFLGLLIFINFQYSIFFANNNISKYVYLNSQNNLLKEKISKLNQANKIITIEINELTSSKHALENFARYNLGLVKSDEIYVHIINK